MKIKFLNYGLKPEYMPKRKHYFDVGMDVYATKNYVLGPQQTIKIPLNFGIELPNGFAGFVIPRSSMAAKGIAAQLAPIDPGYTGIIHAIVTNSTDETYNVVEGERIAQLVVVPVSIVDFYEEDQEQRGANGFGSTGK